MYLSSDEVPAGTALRDFDVCIVGAGAAGLPLARRLVGTSKRVLVVAAGQPEEKGLPPSFRQKIYGGKVGDFLGKVDPVFLRRSRLHMFGGTTNHFGFWARPFDEADFRPRPGYRSASWPIQLAELTPYYQEAMKYGRYGPFNFDDTPFWEKTLFGRNFPALPEDELRSAIFHAQYEERYHDFQLSVGEDLKSAANVTVLFNSNLLKIESANQSHVTSLVCASLVEGREGHRFTIVAHSYVLALGGIETVRALKLSGDLGNNEKDHLGRGFMVHPLITTAAKVQFHKPVTAEVRNFFRDQQVRLRNPGKDEKNYVHDTAPLVDPRLLFKQCVFNAWAVLVPTSRTMEVKKIGNFRVVVRFDPQGDTAELNLCWEQVPNEDSRIALDDHEVDPVFGQPVTRLDWRLREEDKLTAVTAMELSEAYLRRHGASDFQLTSDLAGGPEDWTFGRTENALATGDHHMGALRMSSRPEEGIINTDSRFHKVDNLYTAGCAQFPTSGYANPTLTIVALALRLADHLLRD